MPRERLLILIDMGVEPYLVASTVEENIAQQLVRRLCPHCKLATPVEKLEIPRDFPQPLPETVFRPVRIVENVVTLVMPDE